VRCGGFVTRPAFMQDVHTVARRTPPFSHMRIFCTLGFQRRFERLCEKLTWKLKCGFLSQISQTADMAGRPRMVTVAVVALAVSSARRT
jgi:hypothetical protein